MIGADFDKIEGNKISIEFFPNRPDLASVEGIARASRNFFGFELGLKNYDSPLCMLRSCEKHYYDR